MVDEFAAEAVIDLGCGTGLLARRLARIGVEVMGVDPAAGRPGVVLQRLSRLGICPTP